MKRIIMAFFVVLAVSTYTPAQTGGMTGERKPEFPPKHYDREEFTEEMRISRGGQLYDNWWKATVDTIKPKNDHPLWKEQTYNMRSGYSTYRCKECHGWDYRGRDGAYGKGSHYTGFAGVYGAAERMSLKEFENVLEGSVNRDHDFSKYINESDISDLALFLKKGLVDMRDMVNSKGEPANGDRKKGLDIFTNNCLHQCHGESGKTINFGSDEKHEYLGTVANNNPWEFIHKVRAGQPGTRMPSAIINGFSEQDMRDLLTYVRTLPESKPEEGFLSRIKKLIGLAADHSRSYIPVEHRGYGPEIIKGQGQSE